MCNHLTVLAQAGHHRAVAQCEHGALHLSWDIATLRLRPYDFLTLAQFLERAMARASAPLISEGWCQLSSDRNGAARLWIGQAGLALAAADLGTFVTLIAQASVALRAAAARPDVARRALLGCPRLASDGATLGRN